MKPYSRIMAAVDNSPNSETAAEWALAFARSSGASLTAVHVYNARQHELAFRRIEPWLPPEHQNPVSLDKQRAEHQTLIEKSLGLIASSYLGGVERKCQDEGIHFEGKTLEGKHYLALCDEAKNHDLVCMGAYGLGWVPGSIIGGVCERVLRRCRQDVLIVKVGQGEDTNSTPSTRKYAPPRKIAVGVDGSEASLLAVARAAWLAGVFGATLEGIYVFDPFFHRLAFGKMKNVLSVEAKCLFKSDEQEVLHDTVIDEGLSRVGERHLKAASEAAEPFAKDIRKTVLKGKPFLSISEHVKSEGADLLVLGRFGSHFHPEAEIGNTAENLARLAPCSVLVVNSQQQTKE
jgi:nucleotide-binding universal stress UspA family protein